MGINDSGSFTFKYSGVGAKLIFDLKTGKRIDVDGNALAFELFSTKSKCNINLLVLDIVEVLKQLSVLGFIVQLVFDNLEDRPHTK